ncbi:MAG: hypothetical protein ABIQ59_07170 [Nocardioidaceae bacterium]
MLAGRRPFDETTMLDADESTDHSTDPSTDAHHTSENAPAAR